MRNFKIAEPQSLVQVTSLLAEKRERYYLLAGGSDIMGEIKDEIIEPEVLIDLKTVPNLSFIRKDKDGVRIGALTTLSELNQDPLIAKDYRGLREAADSVGTPQLRNMGTVGGNLCQRPRCWYYRSPRIICRKKGGSRCYAFRGRNKYHAILGGGICYIVHPSDLAPALVALEADVVISSPRGKRTIPLAEFFTLPQVNVRRENVLNPDEVLQEVKIPPAIAGEKSTYIKFRERGAWDFAIVSAAVKGNISGGVFKDIRIALGGVAPIPWRLEQAEKMIKGVKVTENVIRKAAREALKEARPLQENSYKVDLTENILCRAVLSLVQ